MIRYFLVPTWNLGCQTQHSNHAKHVAQTIRIFMKRVFLLGIYSALQPFCIPVRKHSPGYVTNLSHQTDIFYWNFSWARTIRNYSMPNGNYAQGFSCLCKIQSRKRDSIAHIDPLTRGVLEKRYHTYVINNKQSLNRYFASSFGCCFMTWDSGSTRKQHVVIIGISKHSTSVCHNNFKGSPSPKRLNSIVLSHQCWNNVIKRDTRLGIEAARYSILARLTFGMKWNLHWKPRARAMHSELRWKRWLSSWRRAPGSELPLGWWRPPETRVSQATKWERTDRWELKMRTLNS